MSKISYKSLKPDEAKNYIMEHSGIKKTYPGIYFCNIYDCNNNTLLVENTKEKTFILYENSNLFYNRMEKNERIINEHPLAKHQVIIKDLEKNKELLLTSLFKELGVKRPNAFKEIDLKLMNKKIKEYGYEKAYFDLLLNLIVFCGEYVREQKGGHWILIKHPRREEYEPIYIDGTGRKYDFWINGVLKKQYSEKEKFDIKGVIEGVLLPEVFKVVPNPTLGNPNNMH